MPAEIKIPDASHPITVTPTGRRVTVEVGGKVIADTTDALTLQESTYPAVQYLPLESVDPAVLRRTETTSYCPYKGEASYYSIATEGGEITDAIWAYEAPYPSVIEIAGHVAFYPNKVDISVS